MSEETINQARLTYRREGKEASREGPCLEGPFLEEGKEAHLEASYLVEGGMEDDLRYGPCQ